MPISMSQIEEKIIFFAYQGKSQGTFNNNVESIKHAIREYNQYQKTYTAKSWEDYKKTTPINTDILNAINQCEVFVSDLTYFNCNVLFELGYAIGKNKKILIILNREINNSENNYRDSFLKILRYTPFQNSQDLKAALQQKSYEDNLIKKFTNVESLQRDSIDLLYLKNGLNDQPSLDLNEQIESLEKLKGLSLLVDDPLEVAYRPVDWYLQNIYKAKCVVIHFRGNDMVNASTENAKNSFLAGLAVGFNQKTLLVAPAKYRVPLDYDDICVQYQSSQDLITVVSNWLEKELITEEIKEKIAKKEKHELNLIKLGIGCEIAENEKDDLLKYFLEIAPYYSALNQEKIILVGRKGSGKSAIYIKILDELSKNSLNYVINLKPESSELLEDIQLSSVFKNPATKKTFFISIWKLTIFSKLAYSVYEKLLSKPSYVEFSSEEEKLINFVREHESFIKMNVFGVISEARKKIKNSGSDLNSPRILEELYQGYLSQLKVTLKEYFESIKAKYYKIVVIADNLDQAWDSKSNLDIQSEMIISLLEVDNQIKNELIDKGNRQVGFKIAIFLRKDIYDYILKEVKEPDKLTIMTSEIDWEQYPRLLQQVIENRFKYSLGLKPEENIEKTWREFFELKNKKHPFEIIDSIVTRRPRDVIYFVSQLFNSAINRGGDKVNAIDLKYAIENYSNFLNNNLIAETKAEYPEIGSILAKLQEHHGQKLEYQKYSKILSSFKYNQKKKDEFTKTLFNREYMLGFDTATNQPFSDIETLNKKLKEKKWFFFPNKVYVIAHAKYYLIKNIADKSF